MTASDQMTRPPDAPPPGPEWVTFPGARDYQASHRGKIRSFKRDPGGLVMKLRDDADEYLRFNYTDDDRVRHHNFSVARAVLLAHDPRPDAAELHACHGPGGKHDNRWPENIYWGTPDQNRLEALEVRLANSPPRPKPLKVCVRCGAGFDTRGQRCRPCIVWFAEEGARRLAGGMDPEQAAQEVGYPSAIGLIRLGMKHAGLRFVVTPREDPAVVTLSDSRRRLRRVRFRREGSRQNSDAQ